MHHFKVLAQAVTRNGPCSPHLFITLATILHTSGERIEASPPGSSLAPNMGIGSFDQVYPPSTASSLHYKCSHPSLPQHYQHHCFLPCLSVFFFSSKREFYFRRNASEKSSEIMTGTFNNVERRMAKYFVAASGRNLIIGLM